MNQRERFTEQNSELREWLWQVLSTRHRGAQNAITWEDLAAQARHRGFVVHGDERNLREETNALQELGGECALICSSSRKPWGVYIAASMPEFRAYHAETLSRAMRLIQKAKMQENAAEAAFRAKAEQLDLFRDGG